jgi:hypothetical protein
MATTGHYVAWRVRRSATPYVTAYGECVLRDVMAGFSNLEKRADEVANAAFERYGSEPAGDDFDGDMSVFAERAEDEGIAFYETTFALRQATLNLFTAGLFHLLEQQLADLCRDASFDVAPPNDTRLAIVARWYGDHFQLQLEIFPEWTTINELRLIANSVKHAEGGSAEELRRIRPELFEHPSVPDLLNYSPPILPVRLPLAGNDLYVSEDAFRRYSQAATQFLVNIAAHFEAHGDEYYPR